MVALGAVVVGAFEMRELADAARPDASPYRSRLQGPPEGCVVLTGTRD